MTAVEDILTRACTCFDVQAGSKKRALELASETIASGHGGISSRSLFDNLMARERLGSTGLGHGVAIPHCRLENLDGITAAFMKLAESVDFDAADDQPVDLVFVLVVPEDRETDHLAVLARLARAFDDADNRDRLRAAASGDHLFDTLTAMLGEPGAAASGALR